MKHSLFTHPQDLAGMNGLGLKWCHLFFLGRTERASLGNFSQPPKIRICSATFCLMCMWSRSRRLRVALGYSCRIYSDTTMVMSVVSIPRYADDSHLHLDSKVTLPGMGGKLWFWMKARWHTFCKSKMGKEKLLNFLGPGCPKSDFCYCAFRSHQKALCASSQFGHHIHGGHLWTLELSAFCAFSWFKCEGI